MTCVAAGQEAALLWPVKGRRWVMAAGQEAPLLWPVKGRRWDMAVGQEAPLLWPACGGERVGGGAGDAALRGGEKQGLSTVF